MLLACNALFNNNLCDTLSVGLNWLSSNFLISSCLFNDDILKLLIIWFASKFDNFLFYYLSSQNYDIFRNLSENNRLHLYWLQLQTLLTAKKKMNRAQLKVHEVRNNERQRILLIKIPEIIQTLIFFQTIEYQIKITNMFVWFFIHICIS